MGIQLFNHAALVELSNVIGPNGSNSDEETSHFEAVAMLQITLLPHFAAISFLM